MARKSIFSPLTKDSFEDFLVLFIVGLTAFGVSTFVLCRKLQSGLSNPQVEFTLTDWRVDHGSEHTNVGRGFHWAMREGKLRHTPFIAEQIVTRRQYGPVCVFSSRPGRPSLDTNELKVGSVLYDGYIPQIEIGRVLEIDKTHHFSPDGNTVGVLIRRPDGTEVWQARTNLNETIVQE